MKLKIAVSSVFCVALAAPGFGQTTSAPPAPTLASSAGLMVYPSKGQDAAAQGKDESECFNWAKQQSGYDPMSPPPAATVAAAPPPQQGPTGARARGAVRGAAAGAVVGEIADNDADEGARVGAAAGAVAAGSRQRRQRREQEAQADAAQQQAQAQADQANAARAEGEKRFKDGMTLCLTERGYSVK